MSGDISGVDLIQKAREHQLAKGFDFMHDIQHYNDELLQAAYCYLQASGIYRPLIELDRAGRFVGTMCEKFAWPWIGYHPENSNDFDKRIENLARAGAFIAAEIDRLEGLERMKDCSKE